MEERISARERLGLGGFYFAYFAAMGIVLPFFPLWLAGRGLAAGAIGLVVAALSLAKVFAPLVLGRIMDAGRLSVPAFLALGAVLGGLLALGWPHVAGTGALFLLTFAFGLCWATILPVADLAAFAAHEAGRADYARLRLWGSLGFVVASLAAGAWPVLAARLPEAVAMLLFAVALAGLAAPPARPAHAERATRWRALVQVWLISFLMQCSHGAYYGFFSLRLAQAGYESTAIAGWWVLGVLAEIALMALWGARIQAMPARRVFAVCLALAALRWAGMAASVAPWALVPWQLLHAASFAAFHLAAVAAVQRLAGARAASAQGWHGAFGFGLGTALGTWSAGLIAEAAGLPAAFAADALVALLGLAALRMMRP